MNTLDEALAYIATAELEELKQLRKLINRRLRQPKAPAPLKYDMRAMLYAQYLWTMVQSRYPFYGKPDLDKWAGDIAKLTRVDGYTDGQIQAVLKWSQTDPFWRQQVRSGANLRKHFQTMMVRMQEDKAQARAVTI